MANSVAIFKLTDKLNWTNKVQFHAISKDRIYQAETGMSYLITPEWEVGAKYQFSHSNWRSQKLEYKSNQTVLTVANYF